jgi:transcriptional regulator with XRE-family HTH domain
MSGAELRAIRKSLSLTQKTFAQALGIHPVTMANYELGEYPIPCAVELAAKYLASDCAEKGKI